MTIDDPTVLAEVEAALGQDFATANIEFQRLSGGAVGRQSQVGVRLDGAWRVAAGQVSLQAAVS